MEIVYVCQRETGEAHKTTKKSQIYQPTGQVLWIDHTNDVFQTVQKLLLL